jgi:cyclic pyranopterin phosphate synthase
MQIDNFGRIIEYLRISLTDMCNLRCVYCMPEDMRFMPHDTLMQTHEILRFARLFAELGFRKVRFTGGEPTLRKDVVEIVRGVNELPGIEKVALTTNAILLDQLARPLKAAGLKRVNISIDTLNNQKFQKMTRWGNVSDVQKGIQAAEDAGLEVKLNCVVVRGFNDEEDVIELAGLTRDKGWQVRFIEIMPFGKISEFQLSHIVREEDLRRTIEDALGPLHLQNGGQLDGEARMYKLEDAAGSVGFISSVTAPFCKGCNRARLTPDGVLRLCLLRDKEVDLLTAARDGMHDAGLQKIISENIRLKPWGHGLAEQQFATNRGMSEIGG